MAYHNELGKIGEKLAAEYLKPKTLRRIFSETGFI